MTAKIIDGKAISTLVREELKTRVARLKERAIQPGLAVVLVGQNPASQVYVRNKHKACSEVGIYSEVDELPADTSQQQLLEVIAKLNANPAIHGILVQLPLPKHINSEAVLEAISPAKDVDGFHPYNVGRLATGHTVFAPCTPYGIVRMLEHENIPIWGQNVVIVGASNIVGKPMALLLLQKGATVTLCNSKTRDLAQHTILADILVAAVGKPGFIKPEMVKRGATVIDVGINRLADGSLTGDVEFDGAKQRAAYITPVPGGVGPMTITMLLTNTVEAAERVAGG